jgi:small subunit ribosomal protein S1
MLEEEKNLEQEENKDPQEEVTSEVESQEEKAAVEKEEAAEETKAEEVVAEAEEATEEKVEEVVVAEAEETTEESTAEDGEEGKEETEAVEEPVEAETAHDDFDWSVSSKNEHSYTEEEYEELAQQYDSTLTSVFENEIVNGIVTSIQDGDVVLDINFKSDGLVPLSEFRDTPDLTIGDSIEVYVEQQEDARGQLVLSRRKAKLLRAWENIVDSYTNGSVIKGTVISKTKGGLIVDAGGLETFLPGSQIDIKPIIDYDSYVGKTMEFKVVKVNEADQERRCVSQSIDRKRSGGAARSHYCQPRRKVRYWKVW